MADKLVACRFLKTEMFGHTSLELIRMRRIDNEPKFRLPRPHDIGGEQSEILYIHGSERSLDIRHVNVWRVDVWIMLFRAKKTIICF